MNIQSVALANLKSNPHNARTHAKKQIRQIADSITAFGFVVPIAADEHGTILAGHGRYAAAKMLGMTEVPVVTVLNLSAAKKRALALADNKITENAGWDREMLAIELSSLSEVLIMDKLDISITGFAATEIDQLTSDLEDDSSDPADGIDPQWTAGDTVSKAGDHWALGNHRLFCGDARDTNSLDNLMNESAHARPVQGRQRVGGQPDSQGSRHQAARCAAAASEQS